MAKDSLDNKKVITQIFRVSFPHLTEASAMDPDDDKKFSVAMLIPKTVSLSKPVLNNKGKKISISMVEALTNAATDKWGDKAPKLIEGFKKSEKGWPIKNGDDKADLEGYEGHWVVKASAKEDKQPGFINLSKESIDPEEFYAGCYARATLIACAWQNKWGKGVSFSLMNLAKVKEGEKFGGKRNAEADFDGVDDTAEGEDFEEESEDFEGEESDESEETEEVDEDAGW